MNHPSHSFVAIDPGDCPRCLFCDVRSGSRHAEPPCEVLADIDRPSKPVAPARSDWRVADALLGVDRIGDF